MPTYKITDSTTGKKYNFTGDSPPTENEINSALGISREETVSSTNTPPKAPGYLARVQEDVSRSMENIAETGRFMQRDTGRKYTDAFGNETSIGGGMGQKVTAGAIRLASDVVNIAAAPVVEGIVSIWNKAISPALSAVTPNFIKEGASNLALAAIDTEAGRQGIAALNSGVDTYREWSKANPNDAKLIGSVINIAPLSRPATLTTGLSTFNRIAGNLDSAAEKQAARNRIAFIEDLTTPKQTAAVKKDQKQQETGGLLGGRRVIPQAEQQAQIDLAVKLPKINSGNTMLGNQNVVETINNTESRRIVNELERPIIAPGIPAAAPIITSQEIQVATDRASNLTSQIIYGTGNAMEQVENSVKKMNELITKYKTLGTMSDSNALLAARKEFDQWAIKQNKNAFNTVEASKTADAIINVRDSINDLIISKNPHVNVAESFAMQSKLFGILDTLAEKVPAEANNRIGRAWQKISILPGFRNKLSSVLGLATGSGMLGATYYFAPAISIGLFGALSVTVAGKLLNSATAKTYLSFMLKEIDDTILTSKVARDIVALQLSKKTIEELINTMDTQDQQNPNAVQSQVPSGQPVFISPLAPVSTPPLPGPVAQASPQDMPFNVMQGTGIAQALRPQEAYRQAMTGIGGR
jgi:hypothetical protein